MLPLVYHHNYSCPFPEQHRFVMSKFKRLYEYLDQAGHVKNNLFTPTKLDVNELTISHDHLYLHELNNNSMDPRKWRRIGLPWSEGLIERTFTAPNGTYLACLLALEYGLTSHLAGGTHHAHFDFGSGFCMINDMAYSAKRLIAENRIKKALIFDLDVHQGDGTASILAGDESIFTCSIHCEKNFPFRKSSSDLDVGLAIGLQDQDYLNTVERTLESLLDRLNPDLVIYDAGVDVWENDELGHLNISLQGIQQRDELVIKLCLNRHIPITTVIGGGYDKDHKRLAQRHASVVETASDLFPLFC